MILAALRPLALVFASINVHAWHARDLALFIAVTNRIDLTRVMRRQLSMSSARYHRRELFQNAR